MNYSLWWNRTSGWWNPLASASCSCSLVSHNASLRKKLCHRLPIQTDSEPQLQIQQPPDAISIIATPCHVLRKQPFNTFALEESACQSSGFHQQAPQTFLDG